VTERRFTDKPDLDPGAVRSLPASHSAMVENRTLFPSTVVEVTRSAPDRLLVSGKNNRKLGSTVAKGKFRGYALYGLSLEERATCPVSCEARGYCYGNGMQMARRHRIGDPEAFFDRLGLEIMELADEHPDGILIRLHVLGDFPSVEYVSFWADMLNEVPRLAVYGYTHRLPRRWGGDDIGDAIESVKTTQPERFRIRWSSTKPRVDATVVLNFVPEKRPGIGVIVCPAQTNDTGCCASCALCWDLGARDETIAFIKHGPRSEAAALEAVVASLPAPPLDGSTRAIVPISVPSKFKAKAEPGPAPNVRKVKPSELRVEPAYQRDLSGRSISLIRKIVSGWDWAKFKPPVCAETPDGLFVIDGQHTAIAAASHPAIEAIPVLIVDAQKVERRADAFVAHNRDRLAMSALQVFLAEVAAGSDEARAVLDAITRAGGKVPRAVSSKTTARPGEVVAITAARRIFQSQGAARLKRIVGIAAASGVAPINSTLLYGLQIVTASPAFAETAALPDDTLARAVASITNLDAKAQRRGSEAGFNRYRACADLISEAAMAQARPSEPEEAAA
jgi:hypothetical protein